MKFSETCIFFQSATGKTSNLPTGCLPVRGLPRSQCEKRSSENNLFSIDKYSVSVVSRMVAKGKKKAARKPRCDEQGSSENDTSLYMVLKLLQLQFFK
jgi:hypothetical protein